MKKSIYDLELHEMLETNNMGIMRVPGGWIYQTWNPVKQEYDPNGVFVPFNNEFQK